MTNQQVVQSFKPPFNGRRYCFFLFFFWGSVQQRWLIVLMFFIFTFTSVLPLPVFAHISDVLITFGWHCSQSLCPTFLVYSTLSFFVLFLFIWFLFIRSHWSLFPTWPFSHVFSTHHFYPPPFVLCILFLSFVPFRFSHGYDLLFFLMVTSWLETWQSINIIKQNQ